VPQLSQSVLDVVGDIVLSRSSALEIRLSLDSYTTYLYHISSISGAF
jgi:hypothetical protein